MKALKIIGGTILGIILLMVIVSLFLPSTGHIERKATIHAPTAVVFGLINDLHTWSQWDAWSKMDPAMKVTFDGPQTGTGSKRTWESAKVGNGSMTITTSEPNKEIKTQMDFGKMGQPTAGFKFNQATDGTEVTWYMDMNYGNNPIARIMGTRMDKMVGPDFEKGLASLDSLAKTVQVAANAIPVVPATDSASAAPKAK